MLRHLILMLFRTIFDRSNAILMILRSCEMFIRIVRVAMWSKRVPHHKSRSKSNRVASYSVPSVQNAGPGDAAPMHLRMKNATGHDVWDANGSFKDPLSRWCRRIGSKFFAATHERESKLKEIFMRKICDVNFDVDHQK